jgi:prophage antirepressor-like protein
MSEYEMPPAGVAGSDAIDISDFVYAATGAKVRRLTLPDGSHWFPVMDVCRELGHSNVTEAVRRHVPEHMRRVAGSFISREAWEVMAGQGLKKNMVMLSLNGLVRLVNGCVKPDCEPFKNWVAEVVVAVQRTGSYSLERAAVTPAEGNRTTGYLLPDPVMDVIVRLEERNSRLDEEFATLRGEELRVQREMLATMGRLADSAERIAFALAGGRDRAQPAKVTAGQVLSGWRARLVITADVWAVAECIVPPLVEHGRVACSVESIAHRTGLMLDRVRDCLRFLQKRACIRQIDVSPDGAPRYELACP